MGRERSNTFRKALLHLKSSRIDEKLQLLSEIPTNNTTGIYVVEPESIVQDPDIPGEVTREANFDQDALGNGRDTTGLFDVDNTTILTIEPPGDTTYILGPMSSMWYAWGNFSTIGYIRQSDRRMVDLGRIAGQLGSWNGSSNFTSYGQLSLEQAVWFRDTPKLNGADNNTPNYRAFYPGPPSNQPDEYGRYLCVITGTTKSTTITPPPRRGPPTMGGFDPNLPPGSANPFNNLGKLFGEIGDIFNKISKGPEEFFPKGTLVGNALQNVMKGGVNHAAEYNALLPVYLGLSILTGQKLEIPISPSAAKNMVGKIDANALSNVLKINTSTPTNARETINPTSGKTTSVMKDSMGWGAQGGLTYNYNTKTSQLEITSNKTLRTTSGGETVKTATKFGGMASPGKITSFSDIPSPTIPQVQDASTKLISAVSTKLGGPGLDPNLPLDIQLSGMRNAYNSNDISRVAVELGLTLSKTMTQGAASNIVALRKVLVDNGIVPKSDVEKIGGAYGQVSNVYKVDYTNLSKDVKNVIDKKTKANEAFILSESTRSILKNIKKPYILPEQPKQKYKIKLSHNNKTINPDLMKKAEVPSSFKKAEDKMWGKYEKEQNARMSQERKNEVLDHLGGGDHFWEFMTETSRSKNKDIQYTNFGDKSEKVKSKIVRKEELKGDHLVFLQDEKTNEKKTMLQSEINELLAQENMPDEFKMFLEQQNETERYEKDLLFKRVSKRLKKEIDYPDKPAKNGYPNDPPPEMINGMHPDLVDGKKTADRFNRLDPQSAKSMPSTGNPHIDKKVKAATKKPK
jgi:hypothetical protein